MYLYDISPSLQLALVATEALGSPQYLPLGEAPYPRRLVDPAYLRQLHAVANGVAVGLTVMPRMRFERARWEVAGALPGQR